MKFQLRQKVTSPQTRVLLIRGKEAAIHDGDGEDGLPALLVLVEELTLQDALVEVLHARNLLLKLLQYSVDLVHLKALVFGKQLLLFFLLWVLRLDNEAIKGKAECRAVELKCASLYDEKPRVRVDSKEVLAVQDEVTLDLKGRRDVIVGETRVVTRNRSHIWALVAKGACIKRFLKRLSDCPRELFASHAAPLIVSR